MARAATSSSGKSARKPGKPSSKEPAANSGKSGDNFELRSLQELFEKDRRFAASQKELLHFGVRVGKLHDRNLVLAMHNSEERFVMVDGYGEKAAIPIHAWSPWLNSIHTRRRVQILLERLHKQYGASLAR